MILLGFSTYVYYTLVGASSGYLQVNSNVVYTQHNIVREDGNSTRRGVPDTHMHVVPRLTVLHLLLLLVCVALLCCKGEEGWGG